MKFNIRAYQITDLEAVARLFYETVHSINATDYTKEQLFAWSPNTKYLKSRSSDLLKQYTLVAEADGEIIGFGSIDGFGVLDLLFVHKDYQRRGVATALCDTLEKGFAQVKAYVSITAKPFFEKREYRLVREREVERAGVKLKNYEMVN